MAGSPVPNNCATCACISYKLSFSMRTFRRVSPVLGLTDDYFSPVRHAVKTAVFPTASRQSANNFAGGNASSPFGLSAAARRNKGNLRAGGRPGGVRGASGHVPGPAISASAPRSLPPATAGDGLRSDLRGASLAPARAISPQAGPKAREGDPSPAQTPAHGRRGFFGNLMSLRLHSDFRMPLFRISK